MIEVSITFGTVRGDGIDTYTVAIEPDGFDTQPYFVAIVRALEQFKKERPAAIVENIRTRPVPPKGVVLEVEL